MCKNLLKALDAYLDFLSPDAVRVRWDIESVGPYVTGASHAQIASQGGFGNENHCF
jgi:hypothetical protein